MPWRESRLEAGTDRPGRRVCAWRCFAHYPQSSSYRTSTTAKTVLQVPGRFGKTRSPEQAAGGAWGLPVLPEPERPHTPQHAHTAGDIAQDAQKETFFGREGFKGSGTPIARVHGSLIHLAYTPKALYSPYTAGTSRAGTRHNALPYALHNSSPASRPPGRAGVHWAASGFGPYALFATFVSAPARTASAARECVTNQLWCTSHVSSGTPRMAIGVCGARKVLW